MATPAKLVSVGDFLAVVLPKELQDRLELQEGETLYLSEVAGGIQITPRGAEFAAKMEAAERVIARYPETLKKLAE